MASDKDWVDDVRRWYETGRRQAVSIPAGQDAVAEAAEDALLGYEAAHPALQALNWPEATAFRAEG